MKTARMRLRITEKDTRRTYRGVYPWDDGIAFCYGTGVMKFIPCGMSGYKEYNERGEPVLDSWIEQPFYVTVHI